jgi:hypothetical protein
MREEIFWRREISRSDIAEVDIDKKEGKKKPLLLTFFI